MHCISITPTYIVVIIISLIVVPSSAFICVDTPESYRSDRCEGPVKQCVPSVENVVDFADVSDAFFETQERIWELGAAATPGSKEFCESERSKCLDQVENNLAGFSNLTCTMLGCSRFNSCVTHFSELKPEEICGPTCKARWQDICLLLKNKNEDGGIACDTDADCNLRPCYSCESWCHTDEQCNAMVTSGRMASPVCTRVCQSLMSRARDV